MLRKGDRPTKKKSADNKEIGSRRGLDKRIVDRSVGIDKSVRIDKPVEIYKPVRIDKPVEISDVNQKSLHKKYKKLETHSDNQITTQIVEPQKQKLFTLNEVLPKIILNHPIDTSVSGNSVPIDCNETRSKDFSDALALADSVTYGRHVCPYCKITCAKPSALQKHVRAHTNERPFPCKSCGVAFKTKSNLYKHCKSRSHALKVGDKPTMSMYHDPAMSLTDAKHEEPSQTIIVQNVQTSSLYVPENAIYPVANSCNNLVESAHNGKESNGDIADSKVEEQPRRIYKPKFHKAAFYQEEEERQRECNSLQTPSSNYIETPEGEKYIHENCLSSYTIDGTISSVNLSKTSGKNEEFSEDITVYQTQQLPRKCNEKCDTHTQEKKCTESPGNSSLSPGGSSSGIDPPFSKKKKYIRNNISSSENSPLSSLSSSVNENVYDNITVSHSSPHATTQQCSESKLAQALLMPNKIESHTEMFSEPPATISLMALDEPYYKDQPLNLSTKRETEDFVQKQNILKDEAHEVHMSAPHARAVAARKLKRNSSERKNVTNSSREPQCAFAIENPFTPLPQTFFNQNSSHTSHTLNEKLARLESTGGAVAYIDGAKVTDTMLQYPHKNPENSIIKNLLLNIREENTQNNHSNEHVLNSSAVASSSEPLVSGNARSAEIPVSEMQGAHPQHPNMLPYFIPKEQYAQYVCHLCKIAFKNADNLEAHQQLYCKGTAELCNTVAHSENMISKYVQEKRIGGRYPHPDFQYTHKQAPHGEFNKYPVEETNIHSADFPNLRQYPHTKSVIQTPTRQHPPYNTIVAPSYPSPGPLLGSTPLVDSYKKNTNERMSTEYSKDDVDYSVSERGYYNKKRKHVDTYSDRFMRDTNPSHLLERDVHTSSENSLSSVHGVPEATLRSLEELSKYPTRPNLIQMFGGQVKILDSGELKTLRIDSGRKSSDNFPANMCTPEMAYYSNNFVSAEMATDQKNVKSSCTQAATADMSSQIVVNIAKSGLHSGGTLVQKSTSPTKVPQHTRSTSSRERESISTLKIPSARQRTSASPSQKLHKSGGSVSPNSAGNTLHPQNTSLSLSSSHTQLPLTHYITNSNPVVNTYLDPSKLFVPILPNIEAPNLAIPGIPAPNIGPHIPFTSFPPVLPDGTLFGGYNPVSIQPHPLFQGNPQYMKPMNVISKPSTSKDRRSYSLHTSSSKRKHGMSVPVSYMELVQTIPNSEQIPYVPGMPGPLPPLTSSTTSMPNGSPSVTVSTEATQVPLDLVSNNKNTENGTKNGEIKNIAMQTNKFKHTDKKGAATLHTHLPSEEAVEIIVSSSVHEKHEIMHVPKSLTLPSVKPYENINSEKSNEHFILNGKNDGSKEHASDLPSLHQTDDTVEGTEIDKITKNDETEIKREEKQITPTSDSKGTGMCEKTFRRPTSLPLKPGSFTPKKQTALGFPPVTVLSLVSPETPRHNKSYAELYLNGQAYTYLIMKCSTKSFFCTLNKLQPMYVVQTPENGTLSMYSNWKIRQESKNNFLQLEPGQLMSLYDSRHRPSVYTVAKSLHGQKSEMVCTHSSYFVTKQEVKKKSANTKRKLFDVNTILHAGSVSEEVSDNNASTGEIEYSQQLKKIDGRGLDTSDGYIYKRGRGRGQYVCVCGIRCKKPSMLKKHIRTHTDVRPYTCRHCTFSFKTKGNLSKHLRSKAHYKKCVQMKIYPIPTTVDDTFIDEECLQKQQMVHASHHSEKLLSTDSDGNEDDDEDDDGEEDEVDASHDNESISKEKREHEAACGLLSLSAVVPGTTSSDHDRFATAGLIPVSSDFGRPSTYPYHTIPQKKHIMDSTLKTGVMPETPTLMPISAEKEREKVSRNTGLASLELNSHNLSDIYINEKGNDEKLSSTICRRGNAVSLTVIQPKKTSLEFSPIVFSLGENSVKSSVDKINYEDKGNEKSLVVQEKKQNLKKERKKDVCVENLPAAKNQKYSNYEPVDLSNRDREEKMTNEGCSSLFEEKSIKPSLSKSSIYTSISDIVPLTEPATLIASLCSSVERCPVSLKGGIFQQESEVDIFSNSAEATMMKAYITERAVKESRFKQHQYFNFSDSTTKRNDTSMEQDNNVVVMTVSSNIMSVSSNIQALNPQTQQEEKNNIHSEDTHTSYSKHEMKYTDNNIFDTLPETTVIKTAHVSIAGTETAESLITSRSSLKTPVKNTGKQIRAAADKIKARFTGKYLRARTPLSRKSYFSRRGRVPEKAKAQFMPPTYGPVPNYIAVNADGREYCIICNKVFSKASQLRIHIAIHYFERPYRCQSCGVSFRSKGHLLKHERSLSHQNKVSMNSTFGAACKSNPRPFQCNDCRVAFRIHGHLAKHLRSKLHVLRLECLGKLPFGTYAEMEREGFNPNDIDTTDCENSLESLQSLAQRLYEKDPSKLNQWGSEKDLHANSSLTGNSGETSSDEGETRRQSHDGEHTTQGLNGVLTPPVQESEPPEEYHSTVTESQKLNNQHNNATVYAQNVESYETHTVDNMNINVQFPQKTALMNVYSSEVAEMPTSAVIRNPLQSVPLNQQRQTVLMKVCDSVNDFVSDIYVKSSEEKPEGNFSEGEMIEQSNHDAVSVPLSATLVPHSASKNMNEDFISRRGELYGEHAYTDYSATGHKAVSEEAPKSILIYAPNADYEDVSDDDSDRATKISYTCPICMKVFLDLGGLQIHSFVEHDSSVDMTDIQQSMAQDKINMSMAMMAPVPPIKNISPLVTVSSSSTTSITENINNNVCPINNESLGAQKVPDFTGTPPKKRIKFGYSMNSAPQGDISSHTNENHQVENNDISNPSDNISASGAIVNENVLCNHDADSNKQVISAKEYKPPRNNGGISPKKNSAHSNSSRKHSDTKKNDWFVIPASSSVNLTLARTKTHKHKKHGANSSRHAGENEAHSSKSSKKSREKKDIHTKKHKDVNKSGSPKRSQRVYERSNESDSDDGEIKLSCNDCGMEPLSKESLEQHLLTHSQ